MKQIRVLVVEDSLTVRKRLCDLVSSDPGLSVVGEAGDGATAIDLCERLRPDVMTLDIVLPAMSGLAVTEYVMARCPTPILIVSASLNRGEIFKTYDALAAGALDVLDKPRGDESDAAWGERFLGSLKLLSRIKVITHPRGRLQHVSPVSVPPPCPPRPSCAAAACRAVAIGASTGGPAALVEILGALPAPFPVPILVVLHIGEPFGTALAEWLDAQTGHRVRYPRDGEPLEPGRGRVFLARPESHLVVQGGKLLLTAGPERHSCRPSVDVLFESLAAELGSATVACLLTGMGRDGAAGLLAIRRVGGVTIAQDRETSVVWGMPGEAVSIGAAGSVLALSAIAPALAALGGEGARKDILC